MINSTCAAYVSYWIMIFLPHLCGQKITICSKFIGKSLFRLSSHLKLRKKTILSTDPELSRIDKISRNRVLIPCSSFFFHENVNFIPVRVTFARTPSNFHDHLGNYYTCDKQVLWESAGAFFSARQLSDFTPQLAGFTRSWSSGKMLAF